MADQRNLNRRLNRGSDMDDALFDALASAVPDKDTGPEPEQILEGLLEDGKPCDSQLFVEPGATITKVTVALDGMDMGHARQIIDCIREHCGEQIDLTQAIKVALYSCEMDETMIYDAFRAIGAGKRRD